MSNRTTNRAMVYKVANIVNSSSNQKKFFLIIFTGSKVFKFKYGIKSSKFPQIPQLRYNGAFTALSSVDCSWEFITNRFRSANRDRVN